MESIECQSFKRLGLGLNGIYSIRSTKCSAYSVSIY